MNNEKIHLKYHYYKDIAVQLKKTLTSTKIFLNMVIHDLRNPTSQIKFAIDQALSSVDRVDLKTEKLEAIYISYIN